MVSTVAEQRIYTEAEYFALEERSSEKHNFYNGIITPMPGASILHNYLTINMITAIRNAIRNLDKQYMVLSNHSKIQIESKGSFVYPDAVVICEKPEYFGDRKDTIINPLLIIEVLSPSTQAHDRAGKFDDYRTLPSFREYVLVQQYHPHVATFYKEEQDLWRITDYDQAEATISFASLGCSISMQDIYSGAETFEEFKAQG